MKTKILFVILFTVAMGLILVDVVKSYTYDGEIDPKQFFTYEPLSVEPLSGNMVIMLVKSLELEPRFAILCLAKTEKGFAILAYAYYDKNSDFKHFMVDRQGHYIEYRFNESEKEIEKRLKKRLNKARGISSATNIHIPMVDLCLSKGGDKNEQLSLSNISC